MLLASVYPPNEMSAPIIPAMRLISVAVATICAIQLNAQQPAPQSQTPRVVVLKPARVFDGAAVHEGWAVRVSGNRIDAVGAAASVAVVS